MACAIWSKSFNHMDEVFEINTSTFGVEPAEVDHSHWQLFLKKNICTCATLMLQLPRNALVLLLRNKGFNCCCPERFHPICVDWVIKCVEKFTSCTMWLCLKVELMTPGIFKIFRSDITANFRIDDQACVGVSVNVLMCSVLKLMPDLKTSFWNTKIKIHSPY